MNMIVWARMQPLDVLSRVEEMLPELDLEEHKKKYLGHISRNGNRSLKKNGRARGAEKVVTGLTLITAGLLQLMMPGNAWQATKIALFGALIGSQIGSLWGPVGTGIGFNIGLAIGTIVALLVVYGIPAASVVYGGYLVVTGLLDMV